MVTLSSLTLAIRFNPRAREGATKYRVGDYRLICVSIHAPVKARQRKSTLLTPKACFNPRAREGATLRISLGTIRTGVSIHAPVKARH